MTDEQRDIIELRRALDAYRRENDALKLQVFRLKRRVKELAQKYSQIIIDKL